MHVTATYVTTWGRRHANDPQVRQIIAIHLQQPPGDILVFMTGQVGGAASTALHCFGCGRQPGFHGCKRSVRRNCQEDIEATCALVVERIEQLDDKASDVFLGAFGSGRCRALLARTRPVV